MYYTRLCNPQQCICHLFKICANTHVHHDSGYTSTIYPSPDSVIKCLIHLGI